MQTETTNSAACIYGEMQETTANLHDNGLYETKRAILVEQGLMQSAEGLIGSAHSSMVVDMKSALTQEK